MLTRFGMNDLERVFGRAVFERGMDYADEGAVLSLRQEGNLLRGQVMGTHSYQTFFQLVPPFECWCTCPYDGSCKHAAALAITWLRQAQARGGDKPSPVPVCEDAIRHRLGRLEARDLVDLIAELIATVPGTRTATLELLLRRDLEAMGREPGLAREEATAVRSMLRSLLSGAMHREEVGEDWDEVSADEDPEDGWEEEEDEWEDDEDHWERRLGTVTEEDEERLALDGQIDTLISSVESSNLPEGLPFQVLALVGCTLDLVETGLAYRWSAQIERMMKRVAPLIASPSCPHEIAENTLTELLRCYIRCDSNLGYLLKPGLVESSANTEVRRWLLDQVAECSRTAGGPQLKLLYGLASEVQANGGALRDALASLEKSGASMEAYLDLAAKCQKALDTEATIDAVRMAVSVSAVSWNRAALRERAAGLLLSVGEREGARSLLQENFCEAPSLTAAARVLDTAEVPEERRAMADLLIAHLGKTGDSDLRVRLHLEAGKPHLALRALEAMKEYRPELETDVATEVAGVDLDSAVNLWTRAIKYLIGKKNRSDYAEAAKALVAMRRALLRTQQQTRWQQYYSDLQARYQSYKALQDELKQSGL